MTQKIHPTAQIHPMSVIYPGAEIAENAIIGPLCIISSQAKIGKNVELISNVTIMGDTTIGDETKVFPYAVLGSGAQDNGYEFLDESKLIIGKNCLIREHVTINRGTPKENMVTIVGNNCKINIGAHIGHDCIVGNNVKLTNNVLLAGHVRIDDYANLGGGAVVHQFCHVGTGAFIGGMSGTDKDVPPYLKVVGRGEVGGINTVGLTRRGVSKEAINAIHDAYSYLYKIADSESSDTFAKRLLYLTEHLSEYPSQVKEMVGFINLHLNSKRGVVSRIYKK